MDLAFRTNQTFTLSFDVSLWKPIYPLSACTFHMQIRDVPEDPAILYRWSSATSDLWGNGTISYIDNPGLLIINAPYSDMILLAPGIYQWDLELVLSGFYKILTLGQITLAQGITRQ